MAAQSGLDLGNGVWSEEQERVPLKQRLKLLLASHRGAPNPRNDVAERNGNGNAPCDLQFSCFLEERRLDTATVELRHAGELGVCNNQQNLVDKCTHPCKSVTAAAAAAVAGAPTQSQNTNSVDRDLCQPQLLSWNTVNIKVESGEDCAVGSFINFNGSVECGMQAVDKEPEINMESLDKLDHVPLRERLKRLLTSKSIGLTSSKLEDSFSGILAFVSATSHPPADGTGKGKQIIGDKRLSVNGNAISEIDQTLKSESSKSPKNSYNRNNQAVNHCSVGNRPTSTGQVFQLDDHMNSCGKNGLKNDLNCGNAVVSDDNEVVQRSAPVNFSEVRVKVEPLNYNGFETSRACKIGQVPIMNLVPVKTEAGIPSDSEKDELDHMSLTERMKLLPPKDNPSLNFPESSECMKKRVLSPLSSSPVVPKTTPSLKVNRPRKRRKTVTDSVETAMEEDAPGLLQVLIEKGVSVDEIKLYGEPECNEAVDDSSADDNFVELEEVIAKLFSQRESFLKFGPLRCSKGERASYCLECLFSLVEQARYLRFRNWPVEWGWCRDLQSFIFVFERHNRIVLERPEYGYATYFFELADSLPIDWQVKRLVTAMKLTSCSRITLIENKALMVGDDLTEGEAKVLMGYGWIPNTGLGTMLNYHDRVVHDRKNEKERSEWRSKIGKLLMDGYNGGTLVSADIPSKVTEYNVTHPVQIKLELS